MNLFKVQILFRRSFCDDTNNTGEESSFSWWTISKKGNCKFVYKMNFCIVQTSNDERCGTESQSVCGTSVQQDHILVLHHQVKYKLR